MLPRPGIFWIQPYFVSAVLAPGSFLEGKEALRRMLIEVLAAGDQLDGRLGLREFACHVSEELWPFKPLVPE